MTQLLHAPTSTAIYSHHLQRHWAALEQQSELAALYTVINNLSESNNCLMAVVGSVRQMIEAFEILL